MRRLFLMVSIVWLFLCAVAEGATYYVDPSRATNGEGSEASPFNTFTGVTWTGNDFVIKAGTTYTGTITVGASGTAEDHITIGRYGDAALANPVINGGTSVNYLITVNAKNYITIENVKLQNAVRGLLYIVGANTITVDTVEMTGLTGTGNYGAVYSQDSSNVKFYDCYVHHVAGNGIHHWVTGVEVWSDIDSTGWELHDSVITNCGWNGWQVESLSQVIEGNTFDLNGTNSSLQHNCYPIGSGEITDNSFLNSPAGNGIRPEGVFTVLRNLVAGNGKHQISFHNDYAASHASSLIAWNKIITTSSTSQYGLRFGVSAGAGGWTAPRIWNNLIYAASGGAGITLTGVTGASLRNNIVSVYGAHFVQVSSTWTSNYNCWYDPGGAVSLAGTTWNAWRSAGYDANGVNANPQFLDAVGNDFQLKSISPCIGLAQNVWTGFPSVTDYDGNYITGTGGALVTVLDAGIYDYGATIPPVPEPSPEGPLFTIGSDVSDDYASYAAFVAGATIEDGDTVSFRRGETFAEMTLTHGSITLTSHGDGAAPIIDGTTNCIDLAGFDSVTIENLTFTGVTGAALTADGSLNVVVRNCLFDTLPSYGIYAVNSTGWTVEGNLFDDVGLTAHDECVYIGSGCAGWTVTGNDMTVYDESGVIVVAGSGHVVELNNFHDTASACIGVNVGSASTGVRIEDNIFDTIDGAAVAVYGSGCSILRNRMFGSAAGYGILANHANVANLQIYYNLIYNNAQGIYLQLGGNGSLIHNNTVVNNNYGVRKAAQTLVWFSNNIIASNTNGFVTTGGSQNGYNNDVYDNTTNFTGIADPTGVNGNISADPLFTDVNTFDFTLTAQSPCIGYGVSVGLASDIDGTAIYGAPDIGCFESAYLPYVPPPDPEPDPDPEPEPNVPSGPDFFVGGGGSDNYTTYADLAAAVVFEAGDNVYFRGGQTYAETITFPAVAIDLYQTPGTGAAPIIDGGDYCIDTNAQNGCTISGLDLTSAAVAGLLLNASDDCIVTGVKVRDNAGVGIAVHGASTGNLIEKSYIYSNGGIGVTLTGSANQNDGTKIKSCLIYGNTDGIKSSTNHAGVEIFNNTVAANSSDGIELPASSVGFKLQNNILSGNTGYSLKTGATSSISHDHNLYDDPIIDSGTTYDDLAETLSFEATAQFGSPLFTTGAYTLSAAASPAVGTGVYVGIDSDIVGATIYGTPDMGCYESLYDPVPPDDPPPIDPPIDPGPEVYRGTLGPSGMRMQMRI